MPERHTGWMRLRTPDGYTPSGELVSFARKALGGLLSHAKATGLGVATRRHDLPDGTVITVSTDGTTPTVSIAPAPPTQLQRNVPIVTGLWAPRGFVVRLGTPAAPSGVGLPVQLDADTPNPEAAINTDPGTDPARWTADGPCGELLLSRDADAGYPAGRRMVTPVLYSPTAGPGFHYRGATPFEQRPADAADYAAYRLRLAPWDSFYADEPAAAKRALAKAINDHRATLGLDPMQLWPAGYYRPGQLMANLMATNGNLGASSTGYPASYQTAAERLTHDGFPADADDLTQPLLHATELIHSGGSPATALAAWLADPTARAVLETDTAEALFLDVGRRGGYWVASVLERPAWIAAGTADWQPADGRIPPLSWRAFRSLNLGFETFPVNFTTDANEPIQPARDFATVASGCWLRYYRSPAHSEPALGRDVFLHGRAIARAPNRGLVWAAGVIDLGTSDRLVILTHHVADQPAITHWPSVEMHSGMTRYLRVWWADVPRGTLALNPDRAITSWQGGTLIDVGFMPVAPENPTDPGEPNALKYTSAWRFAPDGRRAVALRDYGQYTDYGTFLDRTTATVAYGLFPRALELVFTPTDTGMDVATVWAPLVPAWTTDARSGAFLPDMTLPTGATTSEGAAWPIAVDYAADGSLLYAFKADCAVLTVADINSVTYLGTGPGTTVYASDMQNRVLASVELAIPELNFRSTGYVQCLSVRDGVFVADGTRPRLRFNLVTDVSEPNPAFQPCRSYTSDTVHGVRVWRRGALAVEEWYPCPDGVVFQTMDLCDRTTTGVPDFYVVTPARAMSQNVQGCYAERDGAWVLALNVAPQPATAVAIPADAPVTSSHCGCQTSVQDYAAYGAFVTADEVRARGGQGLSSFAQPPALAGGWFIDAKAV